jgi:uncharacterized membrane protein YciS (DUF1049 family)
MSTQPPENPPEPSAGETPPPPTREPEVSDEGPSTWQPMLYTRIALLLVVIAYSIAFVVQNTDQIKIDFVLATAKVRLIWAILLLLAIGLVGGILLSQLYRHRRRALLAKQGRKPGDSGADLRRRDKAVGKSS